MGVPAELLAEANEMDPTGELAERVEAQWDEYHTYVAATDVRTPGGVPAYRKGDPMPVSNVAKHRYWEGGVAALMEGAKHHASVLDQVRDDEPDADTAEVPTPTPTPDGTGARPLAATVSTGESTEGN